MIEKCIKKVSKVWLRVNARQNLKLKRRKEKLLSKNTGANQKLFSDDKVVGMHECIQKVENWSVLSFDASNRLTSLGALRIANVGMFRRFNHSLFVIRVIVKFVTSRYPCSQSCHDDCQHDVSPFFPRRL